MQACVGGCGGQGRAYYCGLGTTSALGVQHWPLALTKGRGFFVVGDSVDTSS